MSDPPPAQDGTPASMPGAPPAPGSPRSPRPDAPGGDGGGTPAAAADDAIPRPPLDIPPGSMFIDQVPQQRSSVSSMIFMTMLFFFMSNGNTPASQIIVGPDGEIKPRVTELELMRRVVGEYEGYLNGTGNWTEPARPDLLPSAIVPTRYDHSAVAAAGGPFFGNMTGWYRRARVSTIDLLAHSPTSPFFAGVSVPSLNTTSWNETRAIELRGDFDWANVANFDINVRREREVTLASNASDEFARHIGFEKDTWAWVKGSASISARTPAKDELPIDSAVDYDFFGLHYLPNGTYELYGLPDGMRVDIRNIPRLFPQHHNVTSHIVLAELEKELQHQEDSLLLTDVQPDDIRSTSCPILMHLSLPPLPPGVRLEDVKAYDRELSDPTGILTSLTRPPQYWDPRGVGLGGVIIADGGGWAMGIEGGKGVLIDDFWRKTINYAGFATVAQFIVLILLVRQMEVTRTPSTLAKVSLWTIVGIGVSDAWIFSAHLAVGIMSNNKTSLPLIVPGFFALCTAIVFAPRYAVLLHRIQGPERAVAAQPTRTSGDGSGDDNGDDDETPSVPFTDRVANLFSTYPGLKWIGGVLLLLLISQVALTPSLVPFVFFTMHSVWVPQIWRNARRGSARALYPSFVIGLSIARLALPLYGLACPDNVLFVEPANWIWALVAWVAFQVLVLFAQDRFGPAFFLPKAYAPKEGYNYHPLLPSPSDPEAGGGFDGSTTCSICMEEVDLHQNESAESSVLSINRRSYAVAPCHHLFHTKCLQQWMAVKTICPLCKRPLPPL